MRKLLGSIGTVLLSVAIGMGCGKAGTAPDATPRATTSTEPDAAVAAADAAVEPKADATTAQADAAAAGDVVLAAPRYYRAKIQMGGDMTLTAHVAIEGTGGTIDIPMQRIEKAPITNVTASDSEVSFSLNPPGAPPEVNVRFSAKKEAGSEVFVGELDQMGMKLPLRIEAVAGLADFVPKRPQTPQPPFPYTNELVQVSVAEAELACTLSLPEGDGPHPVVLMFTGSGAQDRDETIFAHKPLLVLSDKLVRAGVGTMRCDDRGVGESTGSMQDADIGVFVADGKALVAHLAGRKNIDSKRIGALGHSEGGIVVGELAKAGGVAFVVTLAGPALSGREVSVRQNLDSVLAQGVPADQAAAIEKALDALFGGMAEDLAEAELDKRVTALATAVVAARKDQPAMPVEEVAAGFAPLLNNRWLRSWVKAKPAEMLASVKVPVLALFGELDTQVHGPDHAVALKKAFDKAKKDDGQVEMVMGVNHLFQTATTGKVSEYEAIEETMQPSVVDRVVAWVVKQAGK